MHNKGSVINYMEEAGLTKYEEGARGRFYHYKSEGFIPTKRIGGGGAFIFFSQGEREDNEF